MQGCPFSSHCFHLLMVSANEIKLKYAISALSDLIAELSPLYHVAYDMLHMINAQCFESYLHMIAPWPLEHMCGRQFAVQCEDIVEVSDWAFQCNHHYHYNYCYCYSYYHHYLQ